MVAPIRKKTVSPELEIGEDVNWSSIKLSEIYNKKLRLEASVYGIDGKHARELINNCRWPSKKLYSSSGFISEAVYPTRFKRIYVHKEVGIPLLLPSQINEIDPKPTKFISPNCDSDLKNLKVNLNEILMTRSGTIGNITLVSKTLQSKYFSDDVIRIQLFNNSDLGYIYTFLKTNTGLTLIRTNNYGSVISHIEPSHLENIEIPNPSSSIKSKVNELITNSFLYRDESNENFEQAQKLLIAELKLPPLNEIKPEIFRRVDSLEAFSIKLKNLKGRFDCSYHKPLIDEIIKLISKTSDKIFCLGDHLISSIIILPGRFKRIYVEEGQGVIFIGGKQIFELDPNEKKFLSLVHHAERIKNQLTLIPNMVLITCSGTIGKVTIVPKHWSGWTANQHIIRINPSNSNIAGYIFAWLSTEYGTELIKRFIYGSVVDEIDNLQISQIQIPLLKNKVAQQKINDLVLKANDMRFEAYKLEQEAIKIVNEQVIFNSGDL